MGEKYLDACIQEFLHAHSIRYNGTHPIQEVFMVFVLFSFRQFENLPQNYKKKITSPNFAYNKMHFFYRHPVDFDTYPLLNRLKMPLKQIAGLLILLLIGAPEKPAFWGEHSTRNLFLSFIGAPDTLAWWGEEEGP